MAAKRKAYVKIQCGSCSKLNYFFHKSKTMASEGKKLATKKFCRSCKKHTNHKEAR